MKHTNDYQTIWGYLAPKPAKVPANLKELLFQAVQEHLKFHANDGMSLFVWGTPMAYGSELHYYPISAVDRDVSLRIVQALHERRGLPPSSCWYLFYPFWDEVRQNAVIQ